MHQDLILDTACRKSRQLRPFVRGERFDSFDQTDSPDRDQIFQIFSCIEVVNTKQRKFMHPKIHRSLSDKKLNYRLMASSLRAKVLASLFFVDSPGYRCVPVNSSVNHLFEAIKKSRPKDILLGTRLLFQFNESPEQLGHESI